MEDRTYDSISNLSWADLRKRFDPNWVQGQLAEVADLYRFLASADPDDERVQAVHTLLSALSHPEFDRHESQSIQRAVGTCKSFLKDKGYVVEECQMRDQFHNAVRKALRREYDLTMVAYDAIGCLHHWEPEFARETKVPGDWEMRWWESEEPMLLAEEVAAQLGSLSRKKVEDSEAVTRAILRALGYPKKKAQNFFNHRDQAEKRRGDQP
ncbi:MAG: hypothetical protein AAGF92_17735 [Myxococcota bacterium]